MIRDLAKFNGLRAWQQEKHYVQSLILVSLAESPLVFKGGTYLWFFHGLNRFSEDLDFTVNGKLQVNLPQVVSRDLSLYGLENELKIIKDDSYVLSFRIMGNGPLNTGLKDRCVVYTEISRRERVIDDTIPIKVDFPAYMLPVKRMRGMSLTEIASEKVRAVMTRNKSRDIYDIYYLVTNKNTQFNLDLVNQKLSFYSKKFDPDEFMDIIEKRENQFHRELKSVIMDSLPGYGEIVEHIGDWARKRD